MGSGLFSALLNIIYLQNKNRMSSFATQNYDSNPHIVKNKGKITDQVFFE